MIEPVTPEPARPEPRESAFDRLLDADWRGRFVRFARVVGDASWRVLAAVRGMGLPTRCSAFVARLFARPGTGPVASASAVAPDRTAGRSTATRRPARIGRLLAVGGAVLVALTLGYLVDCLFEIPIDGGVFGDPSTGAMLVQAADGSDLATRGTARGDKLGVDEIPQVLKNAIVAIEDRRFYSHGALDPHGLLRALLRGAFRGHVREGASTLTQQLARLMMLSSERTAKRKVQEAMIAFWLEHHLDKPAILGRYLNTAYFGAGAYGVDAAAKRYFAKSARDLNLPEAAMLAGLVWAPSQIAPHRNLEAAQTRAGLVLRAMVDTGVLSKAEAEAARAHPATLTVSPEMPSGFGYAADVAAADVKALVGNAAQDVTASTTILPALQAAAEHAVATTLDGEGERKDVGQAAVVALGSDGAILAMVGGREYDDSQFNRATQARRQPGSLFKLFVYLAALRQGATRDTPVVDEPVRIGDWEPHNFEKGNRGTIPLHVAFAQSLNTVAAALGQKVGIGTVIRTAHETGVVSDLPDVPSLALGTAEVTLMEMTRAFATVASDQDEVDPFLVRRVMNRDKVLFNRPPLYAGDSEPDAAKVAMRGLLADVVREGTGRAAQLSVPTGGKTGTTQDFRDAWFIGSAPDVTIGVWVGNDDDTPMDGVTGGDLPAKIWHEVAMAAEIALAAQRDAAKRDTVSTSREPASAKAASLRTGPDTSAPRRDQTDAPRAPGATPEIRGEAEVTDTASLTVDGHDIRLQGVAPVGGRLSRALARYLRRRELVCTAAVGETYRCTIEGADLATTILANGGSQAVDDAPADLLAAQDSAQTARRGLWRRRR